MNAAVAAGMPGENNLWCFGRVKLDAFFLHGTYSQTNV